MLISTVLNRRRGGFTHQPPKSIMFGTGSVSGPNDIVLTPESPAYPPDVPTFNDALRTIVGDRVISQVGDYRYIAPNAPAPPREPPVDSLPAVRESVTPTSTPGTCLWMVSMTPPAGDRTSVCEQYVQALAKYDPAMDAQAALAQCQGARTTITQTGNVDCNDKGEAVLPGGTPWYKTGTFAVVAAVVAVVGAAASAFYLLRKPMASRPAMAPSEAVFERFTLERGKAHPLAFGSPRLLKGRRSASKGRRAR